MDSATAANSRPVPSSTRGYLGLIRALQCRQRARRSSQDTTGTLSLGAIGAPHEGQGHRGRTTDSPRGTRQMTTLRNDPMSRPNTPQKAAVNVVTAPSYLGRVAKLDRDTAVS